ncbi:hypothetical protein RRG08_008492 [Elysia crispata]|uniref:Uncharacterized protein n=1 Tax=Elysia crispata TaxID=231223 RepID=A0AAE1DBR4_9GAST|nr:hypothetical protein RRG08_008492 [Elysia crispata]
MRLDNEKMEMMMFIRLDQEGGEVRGFILSIHLDLFFRDLDRTGPEKTTLIQEAWFVWVLVGTIGGTLWLALCVFSVWLFRRRRRNNKKKMAQNGMYSAVPVHKSEESGRPGGGIGRDDVIYSQKEGNIHTAYGGLQSDLASLLDCGHKEGPHLGETPAGGQLYSAASVSGPHSKTYYQRPPGGPCPPPPPSSSSVAPYATTTLINKGVNPQPRPGQSLEAPGAGFRPINHAYVHSSASGSGDSCNKPDMRSSDSNTDNSRPTTAAGCCPHDHCEGLASPSSDSGSITTDENGIQVKRPHKYSRIGGPTGCLSCPNCAGGKQGQQAHMNLAELLPPPPEHPPPHHEMMMVGQSVGPGSRHGGGGNDMGSCTLNRHNPHAYLYGNDTGGSNMAETRFIESRCSPASACSCPQVPHDRMRGNINNNTVSNNTMPYSDMEYPVHSHGSHAHSLHNTPHQPYPRYHEGSHQDGGGGGGPGNSYGCERPYSPKLLNTGRGEAGAGSSSGGSNRCQSPLSCLNCGSSYPPQQQQPPPPAPPSSSSSSNNSQQHHHPQQQQQQPFNPNAPHYHYHNNPHMSQGGGVYPQVGGAYNHQPVALHGYRIPPMEAEYKSHEGEDGGVSMDRACQSSLPSLANDCLQAGYGRRPDSPPSEDHHDYVGESDMEVQQRVDCPTPDSSVNGEGGSASGSMQLAWPSTTDDDTDSVSHDDSDNHLQADGGGGGRGGDDDNIGDGDDHDDDSSSDSSFLADADFASAVARAAQLSGLTVVGTTVTDPKSSGNSKKYRKHRTPPARPHSPYSTDSNMSAVVHKPYPKSDRKKQLLEQARKYGQRKDGVGQNMDIEEAELDTPAYHRPYYPTFPRHHTMGVARAGPVMAVLSDHEGGGNYSTPTSFLYPQLYELHPSPYLRSSNAEPSFAASPDFAPVQYVVRHKCTVDESMEHDITNITTNTSAKIKHSGLRGFGEHQGSYKQDGSWKQSSELGNCRTSAVTSCQGSYSFRPTCWD